MFTWTWQARVGALTALIAVIASGCQAPEEGPVSSAPGQTISRLPVNMAEIEELPPPEILPDTHVAAGRLHESQGRLARAAEQYRLAIGARPDHIEAYNRLGVVLDRLGKFKEADQYFTRAIQLAPDQAYLRNNLAFSYIMQGRWADAEAALTRALEIQPEFPRARVNLGMVLAQQERFEEAFDSFQRVLRPEDAWYNIGLMYQSKRRPVEAAQAFKQALNANPEMVAAQKRLDRLPADIVGEAEKRGALFAAPALAEGSQSGDETPAAPAEPVAEASPAIAAESSGPEAPATRPADSDLVQNEDLFPGSMWDEPWLYNRLFIDKPSPFALSVESADEEPQAGRNSRWRSASELLRGMVAPMEQLLGRLSELQLGGTAGEASPLPVQIAAPQPEGDEVADTHMDDLRADLPMADDLSLYAEPAPAE